MRKHIHITKRLAAGIAALSGVVGLVPVHAADVTYDFTSDPSSVLNIVGNGVNTTPWSATGGNPGGFLALTWPVNSLYEGVVFPNADPGKVVTAFTFTADLRVGNAQGNAGRPADGFSVSFARDGDPVLTDPTDQGGFAVAGGPENGTKTGIAISFDTWSGNTLPDGADVEGLIIRVDNVTVNKTPMATRNGSATDATSLQTGPYNQAYWDGGGDPFAEGSYAGLGWAPLFVQVTSDAKLTVKWKGTTILDGFQTTYFPSAGQLVLASRTGGANENTHFDNIHLVTVAEAVTAVPNAPGNLVAAETGSRRVKLTWAAAVVPGNPNAQVAYEVERDGVVIAPLITVLNYDDRGVAPSSSHVYKVRGKNIAGLTGAASTINVTTVADVDGVGFLKAEQWTGIAGAIAIADAIGDPHYADAPDRVRFVNGFSFGETSNFGDTWGENHLVKITGVFTSPKAGNARFFIRSDDASALYVKAGTTFPDPLAETAIAIESGCCGAFEDVGADGTVPEVTSEPIALTAGGKYAIAYLVKEGGGGDWGQVAIRFEGDTTPAASLTPLRGGVLASKVDAVGASVSITTAPVAQTVTANSPTTFTAAATGSSPYGADYGNVVVYQWYKNGVPILGANAATYTIPVTPIGDNGAKFAVGAGVAGAAALSAEVTLTVNIDTVAPTVARVAGSGTFNSVTVWFSEPVDDATGLDASKYSVAGLTLSAPVRVSDRAIKLTSTTQAENTVYNITVNGVKDLGGNASAYTGTFTSYQFKAGLVTYKTWQGETGGFSTFTDDPPVGAKTPTTTAIKTSYQANTGDEYENYFGQLTGFFVPPATGNYVFFMSSDDHGEMYLSTDANPANKKKIAEEPSWSSRNNWVGNATDNNAGTRGEDGARSNRSDQYPSTEWASGGTITLQAGQKYYLEVLFKEGGGGDNGGATYKLASAADPADGSASALTGSVVGSFVDPGTLPPVITSLPVGAKVAVGGSATLSVVVDSATPVTYQWFQNKKPIAGATSATYTIASAGVGNIGDYYVDVTNPNGSASSYPDNGTRVVVTGASLVVEAEDFNFENGQTIAAASTMPLASDLYKGKDGQAGVDLFLAPESTADGGANGNSLRQGWNDGGTINNAPEGVNADVISDGNAERPDFTLTQNYKIGWGDNTEWYNYTRNFEPGTYSAALGFSWDGRSSVSNPFAIDLVTSDPTKPEQTLSRLGQVTVLQTGGWSSNDTVPFMNADGTAVAEFTLGANSTIRLTIPGGDIDYLLFYKKAGGVAPTVGAGVDGTGAVVITYTGTLLGSDNAAGPFTPVAGATGGTFKPNTASPGAKFYRSSN